MAIFNLIIAYLAGLFGPCYAIANPIMYEPVPVEVVLAMKDIGDGPEHHFKLLPDGRLYVDQGQGWKRLRY
jgi:hypothetical protein